MFVANIRTRSEIFKLDGYTIDRKVLDIFHLCKYSNPMARTIELNKKLRSTLNSTLDSINLSMSLRKLK